MLHEQSVSPTALPAKSAPFNDLAIGEIPLAAESGDSTVLGIPGPDQSLLGLFQTPAAVLEHVEGPPTPDDLINCVTVGLGKKSFGIRDAHDQNNLRPGHLTSFALVYEYRGATSIDIDELLLVAESGNLTVLSIASQTTLAGLFGGPTQSLLVTAGSAPRGEFIKAENGSYSGPPWRTNTQGDGPALIRLGGWVTSFWGCNYGDDEAGFQTGAHMLGFGLTGDRWPPDVEGRKSFDLRDAHDENCLRPGQLTRFAQIHGR